MSIIGDVAIGLYEGWSGEYLDTPQQATQIDDRKETRQLVDDLLTYVNKTESANKRSRAKERIAGLKAEISRQKTMTGLMSDMSSIEGKIDVARINALTDLQETALKAWTSYLTDTSQVYTTPVNKFKRANMSGGGPAAAWGSVYGDIQNASMAIDTQSPKFAATFRALQQEVAAVEMDAAGDIVFDKQGVPVLTKTAESFSATLKMGLQDAARSYQSIKSNQDVALGMFKGIGDTINEASALLKSDPEGKNPATQAKFDQAISDLKKADVSAQSMLGTLDVKSAQEELKYLEQEDKLLADVKGMLPALLEKLTGSQTGGWQGLVTTQLFQQWAADRGITVGYAGKGGVYVPGPNDEIAVGRWYTESTKNPGDYGLLLNRTTDEIVQITDKQGNIIAEGFRQPFHASDREGHVRVMLSGGRSEVFTPDQIGEVQVVTRVPGGPKMFGSPMRRRKMEESLAYLDAYTNRKATKPAEKVDGDMYATREGLDTGDVNYLDKEQYERALAQSDVEVGRVVVDYEAGKAYIRFGDVVFEAGTGENAGALTKVEVEAVVGKVMGMPSFAAMKDDDNVLLYSDIREGEGFKSNIELKYEDEPDESAKLLEAARRKFLVDQGVKLTETPRGMVGGATRDVMGVTFRDATFPERFKPTKPEVKPGQDIDPKVEPSGAPPVAAVRTAKEREETHYPGGEKRAVPKGITEAFVGDRLPDYKVQKGDAEFIRQMLNKEAEDAGEVKPPAKAAAAATQIKKEKVDPKPKSESKPKPKTRKERIEEEIGWSEYAKSMGGPGSELAEKAQKRINRLKKRKERIKKRKAKKAALKSPTPEIGNGKDDLQTEQEVDAAGDTVEYSPLPDTDEKEG